MIEQCDCVYFAASKGLTEIPDDIPDDTPHIVLLDNLITQIKSRTFVDKSVCTEMSLGQTDIQRIEKEAYFGMDALEGLDLHMNRLRFLYSGTFSGLGSLKNLLLSLNVMAVLQPGVFQELTSLEILHLDDNGLRIIQDGTFDGLHKLKHLFLSTNKIYLIGKGVFRNLTSLETLNLMGNKIFLISPGTFKDLPNLSTLQLSGNDLTSFENGIFNNMKKLKILHLSLNRLTLLKDEVFDGLESLQGLFLWETCLLLSNLHPLPNFRDLLPLKWVTTPCNVTLVCAGYTKRRLRGPLNGLTLSQMREQRLVLSNPIALMKRTGKRSNGVAKTVNFVLRVLHRRTNDIIGIIARLVFPYIYLQFPSLFVMYGISKYEIKYY